MNHLSERGVRHQVILRLLLAVGCCVAVSRPLAAEERPPLERRLFQEATRAWERQLDFFATLDGTSQNDRRTRQAGQKWVVVLGIAAAKDCSNNSLQRWEGKESGIWKGNVIGWNSRYSFRLSQVGENRPWAIADVEKRSESSKGKALRDPREFCTDLIFGPRIPLFHKIFRSKGFRCVRVDPEPQSQGLVRVTFTYAPQDKQQEWMSPGENEAMNQVKGGWVVLDTPRYWVIRKGEIELVMGKDQEITSKWIVENEHDREGSDHHPIITKNSRVGKTWQDGKLVMEEAYTSQLDYRERPSIPEEEFTLSAFGLPEPHWATPRKTRWYLWLGVAGVACLTLGTVTWWLRRRSAAVT